MPDTSSIQVFLSSTFVDMAEERKFVVEKTLPELSGRCREAGLEMREIDLRWGITADEIKTGALVELCLDAIERSSIFLAVIGYRYGTTINTFAPPLISRWPWLEECRGKSLTEIEIEYGALRRENRTSQSRVYYKGRPDGLDEPNVARLKEKIESAGIVPREYDDVEHLGRLIHADVWNLVGVRDEAGATPSTNSPLPQKIILRKWGSSARGEVRGHGVLYPPAAMEQLLIQRWDKPILSSCHLQGELHRLKQQGTRRIAVYCDDPGERSAIFADLLRNGTLEAELGCVIAHLCSGSPIQANPNVIVNVLIAALWDRRIMAFKPPGSAPVDERIAKHLPHINDSPVFYEGAGYFKEKLLSVLSAAKDKDVTFVIDGLDQIPALEVGELPFTKDEIPSDLRIIVGVGTRAARTKVEECGFQTIDMSSIRSTEVRPFVENFLARHSKRLTASMLDDIDQWTLAPHLFSLKILLNELRVVDGDALLSQKLHTLTASKQPQELVEKLFERVETSLDKFSAGYMRRICLSLSLARYGVSETYLSSVEQSRSDDETGKGLWNSFRSALGKHLTEGLSDAFDMRPHMLFKFVFRFAGDHERNAVASYFNVTEKERDELHLQIASTLIGSIDPENRCDLAWHLWCAKRWDRLERLILAPRFVADVWDVDRAQCRRYWHDLAAHADVQIMEKFVAKLTAKGEAIPTEIFDLVAEVGSREFAARLSGACAVASDSGPRPFSWAPFGLVDQVGEGRDSFRAEGVRLEEQLEAMEKTRNPVATAKAVLELAVHSLKMASFEHAMKGFDRVIELLRGEVKNPTVATKYSSDDLLAIMIECARGQRDCLVLQGKVAAAREKAQLRNDMIKARENVRLR
jgi:hypothetical protein